MKNQNKMKKLLEIDEDIKEFLQEFIMTTQSIDCGYKASQILLRDTLTIQELKMIIEWGFLS